MKCVSIWQVLCMGVMSCHVIIPLPSGDMLGRLLAYSCLCPFFILSAFATLIFFRRDLHTVSHLLSPAVTCCHLLSLAVTCCHLLSPAVTCCHLLSLAVTCCHLLSLAVTCCHLLSLALNRGCTDILFAWYPVQRGHQLGTEEHYSGAQTAQA